MMEGVKSSRTLSWSWINFWINFFCISVFASSFWVQNQKRSTPTSLVVSFPSTTYRQSHRLVVTGGTVQVAQRSVRAKPIGELLPSAKEAARLSPSRARPQGWPSPAQDSVQQVRPGQCIDARSRHGTCTTLSLVSGTLGHSGRPQLQRSSQEVRAREPPLWDLDFR